MKYCTGCKKDKSLDEYGSDASRPDGMKWRCKECCNAKQRVRRDTKESKIKESIRMKKYGQTKKGKYSQYKSNAKARAYSFNLTYEEFCTFWQQPCFYCDGDIHTVGIDRIDNTLGYSLDNIVSCCGLCNQMKMDLPLDTFLQQIKRIYSKFNL